MSPTTTSWKARQHVDPDEVRAEIAKHGFTIRIASGDVDLGMYLYTVGLTEVGHPELWLGTAPGAGEGVCADDEETRLAMADMDGVQADIAKLSDFARSAVLMAAQTGQHLGPGRTHPLHYPDGSSIPVSFEPMEENPRFPLTSCHDLYGDNFTVLTLIHLAHDDDSSV